MSYHEAMSKKQEHKERKQNATVTEEVQRIYDLSTPLWDKYYEKVRRNIRFPRYYKKAVNW